MFSIPVYPPAPRDDVIDDYHGTKVSDPYRWLENLESAATRQWIEAQNRITKDRVDAIPSTGWIRNRLVQLWNHERWDLPIKSGGRYFFLANDGRQDQSVLYVADDLSTPGRVICDPNAIRKDGTMALADFKPSPDGEIVAYAISDGGADWMTWKFCRVSDGFEFEDVLHHTKYWSISWAPDGSGVYYSGSSDVPDERARLDPGLAIYFHRLAGLQACDRLVYQVRKGARCMPHGTVTEDGRYLVVTLYAGADANAVELLELGAPSAIARPLFDRWDAVYRFIGSTGDALLFHTTYKAPRGCVIAVDPNEPGPMHWRIVVPEQTFPLQEANYVGSRIVANYVRDGASFLRIHEVDGAPVGDVPLPGSGTVGGFGGDSRCVETFFSYTDYVTPLSIYHYLPMSNTATAWRVPRLSASTGGYTTERVTFHSKDGTEIPMTIIRRRNAPNDGDQPVMLYGYGGFRVSAKPIFRASVLTWLEMGGTFAEASIRGGGEFGEEWHLAGTRGQKQNVFDDFISAAEYLIARGYTNPRRLVIHGVSNGGLLVGATLLQRPDLFRAALASVGVFDMLRYHTTSGSARHWASDYGRSDNPDEFKALYAYSPYHNVRSGACYPATMISTAIRDDRVAPWHSLKFAAALQSAQSCPNPVLVHVETRAGHGKGRPTWMLIENHAYQLAFAAEALEISVPP